MSGRLVHRGPRQRRARPSTGRSALAARRLSIIDLEGGDQPIANEDGSVVVVQNGEIYNYRELRSGARAPRATASRPTATPRCSSTSTRSTATASSSGCAGCSRSRSGTRAERRLLLARDRFGIKPLYYRLAGGDALLRLRAQGAARAARLLARDRPAALDAFLAFNSIPAPLTIFAEARKLPAGSPLAWERRRGRRSAATRGRARSPPTRSRRGRRGELAAELRERLRDSVRAHLVADVPVGVLLSGGRRLGGAHRPGRGRVGASAVSTFSIGFEESALRRARAGRGWSPSATAPTTTSWSCARTPSSCCRSWSRPSTSRSATPRRCPPTWSPSSPPARSRSRSPARAATSSSAATTPTSPTCSRRASARLAALARAAGRARCRAPTAKVSFDYKAKRFVRGRAPAAAGAPPRLEGDLLRRCARPSCSASRDPGWDPVDLYRERYAETEGAEPLARLQDLDLGIYLVDDLLVKTDRASMAHSLELRVPFLDQRVAELALGLADPAQGARLRQEAAAAAGAGAAAAEGDRPRPQAGLLDPAGRLAAGAAGAVRPRGALAARRSSARAASTRRR